MARIAAVVFPGQAVALPQPRKDRTAGPRVIAYSPPMKRWSGSTETSSVSSRWSPRSLSGSTRRRKRTVGRCSTGWTSSGRTPTGSITPRRKTSCSPASIRDWISSRRCTRITTGDAHTSAGSSRRLAQRDLDGVAAHLTGYAGVLSEHIKKGGRDPLPLDGPEPLDATGGRAVRAVPRGGRAVRGGAEKVRVVRRPARGGVLRTCFGGETIKSCTSKP